MEVSHLQNVVDRDTLEANEAFAAYKATKIRYEAQVLVLEALQSQLHAAKDIADSLQRHTLSLEEELEQLSGLIHPIRRCPDDVMQTVFELVAIPEVEDGERDDWGCGYGSIQLSHVCRRWRDLSLSTPRIWSCVSFHIHDNSRATKSMASAFVCRVKHIPAKIKISLQFEEISTDKAVSKVKEIPFGLIYSVPNISAINFFIEGEVDPTVLLDAVNGFPKKIFDSLSIYLDLLDPGEKSIDLFISRFHPFRKLKLERFYFGPLTTINLDEALTRLEELDVSQMSDIPLLELFQKMPKLQTLEVHDCNVLHSPNIATLNCTLTDLRSLDMGRGGFPWAQLLCPNLIQLSLDLDWMEAEPEDVWGFISRTKSIREVTLYIGQEEHLVGLARSAAQLERLHLTGATDSSIMSILVNWREVGLEGPPFPQLLALTLRQPSQDLCSLTLDSLIQARCFDVGHPESKMEEGVGHALKDFRIEVKMCAGPEKWFGSRFLETHFSRTGPDPVAIAEEHKNTSEDEYFLYMGETCYAFVGNTGEASL